MCTFFICNCICINKKFLVKFLDYENKHNHFHLKLEMKIKLFTQLLKRRVDSSEIYKIIVNNVKSKTNLNYTHVNYFKISVLQFFQ